MRAEVPLVITAATEGVDDEAVVRRLISEFGAEPGPVHGKNGKQRLRQGINGYNNAANFSPWIVLVDLNHEGDCVPPVRRQWLNESPLKLLLSGIRRIVTAKVYVVQSGVNDDRLWERP